MTFAPLAKGREDSVRAELQGVIRRCLHSYESERLEAAHVQEKLYDIMMRNGWTNQLHVAKKQKKRK